MSEKNLEFLKDALKYLGFGEGLNEKLTENVKSEKPEFQLGTVNTYGKDKVSYSLDFKRSDKADMYFFNRYTASFKAGENGPEKSQSFYINKNAGVTAKEAYNLLNGRSVNKDLVNSEGQKFNAWLQLDFNQPDDKGGHKFRQFHSGYGYNLERELAKLPINDLNDMKSKERLMQSLERGNVHEVNFVKDDKTQKMFIEANPQFKTLNIYDSEMKKVFQEHQKKETKPEAEKAVVSEDKKEGQKKDLNKKPDDESPDKGKRTFSRKGLGV
ncbi:hypothetical protein [Chryseolinea sp. H1M3-3]|uniref:hypothetical protein n=1 Tax=Chryseolinea sp. H1M3-3 TaxID=3034144 RepID=UPI0023EAA943|nr:hypothetical protein [Chryseolinea sp. H1M3-3]